jgi:hypothetical protein
MKHKMRSIIESPEFHFSVIYQITDFYRDFKFTSFADFVKKNELSLNQGNVNQILRLLEAFAENFKSNEYFCVGENAISIDFQETTLIFRESFTQNIFDLFLYFSQLYFE